MRILEAVILRGQPPLRTRVGLEADTRPFRDHPAPELGERREDRESQPAVDPVRVDRELAGLVEMIPGADHLLVENLAAAPAFQGHGRALLAHAEQVVVSLGFAEVRLCTSQRFAANLGFYRRAGYRVEREEAFKGGVAVHLSKAA